MPDEPGAIDVREDVVMPELHTSREMNAVRFHTYGGPEVLVYEPAPRPKTGADDVLIKVHATSVNPVDWKVRKGYVREHLALTMPYIPGWDYSGVVEEVGANVHNIKPGDAVFGREEIGRMGAYAEYIAARAAFVARKPQSLDHTAAASIPIAALTAWQSLFDIGHLERGQRLLIQGAAGGVGTFGVQLAKWKGAFVIGTASERNQQFLRELGADEVIDYNKTPFEDAVHDVDMVFDCVGGEVQQRSLNVIKPGGMLVTIVGAPDHKAAAAKGVRAGGGMARPDAGQLAEIARLVVAGTVKPVVSTVLPLAEARKAHELSEGGHTRGKIVLKVVE